MLIGTIPILALVVPSTAAGSFQLLKGKAAVYESVAALVTIVSAPPKSCAHEPSWPLAAASALIFVSSA
eukprot:6184005-Pleurochrysis_carterae.AAC.6